MNFPERSKKIFGYFNGSKQVFADPLALDRQLRILMGGDCNKIVEAYNSDNPIEQEEAAKVFIPAIIGGFGIASNILFNNDTGNGWLEADLVALWDQWATWIDEKKNQPETPPISSPPTVPGLPRQPGI